MGKQSPIRLLAEQILSAVSRIEDQFEAAGLDFPSLADPFNPQDPTTALLFSPEVSANSALICGAAEQLLVSVRPPPFVVLENTLAVSDLGRQGRCRDLHCSQFHKSSCLQTVTVTNVPEILREAGPQVKRSLGIL